MKIKSDYRPSLALMVRWSFVIDATVGATAVRRRCTLWRSCSSLSRVASPWTHAKLCGWERQGCWCWSTRVVVVVGGGGGGGGGGWGREVSHVTPGSALCHLPFCCSAALICAHSSLVQDWDLLMDWSRSLNWTWPSGVMWNAALAAHTTLTKSSYSPDVKWYNFWCIHWIYLRIIEIIIILIGSLKITK